MIATHALKRSLFADHAQQLYLSGRRNFGHFIQKNRAAVRLLESSNPAFVGAGERAFFVAEQFAFEQRRRERGTMNGDEFRFVAPAQIVNRVRRQFLSRAAFAFD